MTAFGTVGATASAVGIAWWGYRRSDRLARLTRHRAQASQVAAWVGSYAASRRVVRPSDQYVSEGDELTAAVVKNASSLPIFDVEVTFVLPDGSSAPSVTPVNITVVPPGDERAVPRPQQYSLVSDIRAVVHFRDASGAEWFRDRFGELREFNLRPETSRTWRHPFSGSSSIGGRPRA
jgi:hypothetical protein